MVTHYSIPLFRWVTANTDIDLHVLYGEERAKYRVWDIDFGDGYSYEVLPSRHLPRIEYVINPTLPSVLEDGKFDVIMATDANEFGAQKAYLAAKRLGIPFALWTKEIDFVDADPYFSGRDIVMFLPRLAKKLALAKSQKISDKIKKDADSYLAFSPSARDHILRKGGKSERIVTINNTLDVSSFRKRVEEARVTGAAEGLRRQLGWEGKRVILSLAYVQRRKGIHILLDAFAALGREDAVLAIVGDGPFKGDLEAIVKKRNIKNVEFHPNTKTPINFYLASDVASLATVGPDPCPLGLVEAFLCGCPVIVSENVGSADILPDQRLVVPPGNVLAVRKALELVLDDPDVRQFYRQDGPRIVERKCSVEQAGRGLAEAIRLAADTAS